jgi:hypothetical protein
MHPDFEKNGYMVARKFFDDTTIALLQTYFDFKYRFINFNEANRIAANKSVMKNSVQDQSEDVASSFMFYADLLIESVHLNYNIKASELMREDLTPTYSFARIYERGDPLIPHTDRAACEISATCPILTCEEIPSTVYISDYKFDYLSLKSRRYTIEEIEKRGDYTEVNLYPGDALFYNGCERYHWRKPLADDYLFQFFMHYVRTDGLHKEWAYDKRPYSGFPQSYSRRDT